MFLKIVIRELRRIIINWIISKIVKSYTLKRKHDFQSTSGPCDTMPRLTSRSRPTERVRMNSREGWGWPGLGTAVSSHLGDLAGTGDCSQRQLRGLGTAVPAAGWDCRGLGTAVILSYLRLNGTGTAVEKQNEGLQSPVLDCVWLGGLVGVIGTVVNMTRFKRNRATFSAMTSLD